LYRDLPQATLAMDAAAGQRVGLSAKVGDGPAVLLCSLREGGQESCNLDIVLDSYSEFSVTGGAAVHLAGYYMPEYEGARRGGPPLAAGGRMADPCGRSAAPRAARARRRVQVELAAWAAHPLTAVLWRCNKSCVACSALFRGALL